MSQADTWTERFGISDDELARWQKECGGEDVLRWALLNGRVPEPEYMQWAMEALQMPSVSSDFFMAPPDLAFWERVKPLYNWSAEFFPLAEWDGLLLIACIEPPSEFRMRTPHRFVLASARNLLLHWNQLNPGELEDSPNLLQPIARVPMHDAEPERDLEVSSVDNDYDHSSLQLPPVPEPSHEAVFEEAVPEATLEPIIETPLVEEPPVEVEAPVVEAAAFEMPEGFAAISLEPVEDAPVAVEEAADEALPVVSDDSALSDLPNGFTETNIADFNFDFSGADLMMPAKKSNAKNEAPTILSVPPEPVVEIEPEPVIEPEPEVIAEAPAFVPPAFVPPVFVAPPPPPAAPPVIASFGPAVVAPAPKPAPTPSAAPSQVLASFGPARAEPALPVTPAASIRNDETNTTSREETGTVTLAQVDLRTMDSCINLDDLGAVAMVHTLRIFNGAMVLLFQGGSLKPWKWSDLLTSDRNSSLKAVELETPSIFRVVARTRLPYHGYVAPSTTNAAFFGAFHSGTLPAHVTLVPIVLEDENIGMIMGVSNVEISYKESLKQMERLSEDFGNRLRRLRKANAA